MFSMLVYEVYEIICMNNITMECAKRNTKVGFKDFNKNASQDGEM